jgi:hypothetical protein
MAWPLTKLAGSLEQLYILRFILGASVAPLAAASAWLLSPAGYARWIAGALAGMLLALDPGLVDTLVIAFRGYGAPELVGLATLFGALALQGHRWALAGAGIALIGAAGQHPMGTGMLLGGLFALPWFAQSLGRKSIEMAIGVTGVIALPRLWLIRQQSDCGQPAMDCIRQVALGSSEQDLGAQAMLSRAFHDRFNVELLGLWPIFLLGFVLLLLPLARWTQKPVLPRLFILPQPEQARPLLAFALGGTLGILLLGGSVSSLRPYHLRIASVPLAVAASVGLCRLWPLVLGASAWACTSWVPLQLLAPGAVSLSTFDELAQALEEVPGPIWVDGVYLDSPVGLDPAAVVLAAILQGQDPERFDVGGASGEVSPSVVFLINGSPQPAPGEPDILAQGETWTMVRFEDVVMAQLWLSQQDPAAPTGGAWDWYKVLQPEAADLAHTSWPSKAD